MNIQTAANDFREYSIHNEQGTGLQLNSQLYVQTPPSPSGTAHAMPGEVRVAKLAPAGCYSLQ